MMMGTLKYTIKKSTKKEYDFIRKEEKNMPEEEWILIENALPALISYEYYEKIQKSRHGQRQLCKIFRG